MNHQDRMRGMLGQLAELDSAGESPAVDSTRDELTEQLAAEYRTFLGEFGAENPGTAGSSQAKPATAPAATPAATSSQATDQTQQELEKNIAQLKPALGTNIDPKKTAQALAAAAAGTPGGAGNATKDLAPALGKMLADPSLAGQFKALLGKLK